MDTEQQEFDIKVSEYDKEKSIERALEALSKYRDCLMKTDDDYLPSGVASYTSEPKYFRNAFHSTVEDAVLKKDSDLQYINWILRAFNRMRNGNDKMIIEMKYIKRHSLSDRQIRNKNFWGRTTLYYRHQSALFEFSKCCDIAVFKK